MSHKYTRRTHAYVVNSFDDHHHHNHHNHLHSLGIINTAKQKKIDHHDFGSGGSGGGGIGIIKRISIILTGAKFTMFCVSFPFPSSSCGSHIQWCGYISASKLILVLYSIKYLLLPIVVAVNLYTKLSLTLMIVFFLTPPHPRRRCRCCCRFQSFFILSHTQRVPIVMINVYTTTNNNQHNSSSL